MPVLIRRILIVNSSKISFCKNKTTGRVKRYPKIKNHEK